MTGAIVLVIRLRWLVHSHADDRRCNYITLNENRQMMDCQQLAITVLSSIAIASGQL